MKRYLSMVLALLGACAGAATVAVDPDCTEMGAVTWSEQPLTNGTSRLSLKATAEDGYAFSGWFIGSGDAVAWTEDARYAGALTATVTSNAAVYATFIPVADDELSFDVADALPEELAAGESVYETLVVDSGSFPTVTFRNLPTGLAYNTRTLTVYGTPTEPGVYEVEARAVNASGFEFRSFMTVRVPNVESARVFGLDDEIPLGTYYYAEPDDLFHFSETPSSVTLSGDVPGLVWKDDWALLYGTPTEAGDYTLRVRATFPTGAVETATMTLSVYGPDPDAYGIDFGPVEELHVGDELDGTDQIAADGDAYRISSVTGLPSGLRTVTAVTDGLRHWYVTGLANEAGRYTVDVGVLDYGDGTQRVVTVRRTVAVADAPQVYLQTRVDDPSRGTVSGGGAVSTAKSVTLTATARTGYVFAGWYDEDGERLVLVDGVDYREPQVVLPAGTDILALFPVAHFVPTADDTAPDLYALDNVRLAFDPEAPYERTFAVDSPSLPTLTFRGLPSGMDCTAVGDGTFTLAYDPAVAAATPGRYAVSLTAVNGSGRRSGVTFSITVLNRSDDRVHVESDYGEFTPGEAIEPISLADAVDFDAGETLAVSGLPRGLVYNAKANAKKGIEARTITGTPTVPGDYTITFKARLASKETVTVTSFITILPYPEIALEITDDDAAAAGCKVTGGGNYKVGTKVTLRATAAKGWVFAGWDGLFDLDTLAALNPKVTVVSDTDDTWVSANFVPLSEDALYLDEPSVTENGFAAEWALKEALDDDDATLVADLIETVSWPTVKVTGLPSGVKFSSTTFLLSGKPAKSGVFHVTVTAKNAGGYSFVRVFDVAVANADGSLPEETLGNAAEIDFTPLMGLTTGVYVPTGSVTLVVGTKPGTGAAVTRVALRNLPSGLAAATALLADGRATAELKGTPVKPGRQVVTVTVTYADRTTLKSQAAVVVEDGGSEYLTVLADGPEKCTVSGGGVYASGATVKLVAKAASKCAFTGWCLTDLDGSLYLFEAMADEDGVDPRTAKARIVFRPNDFGGDCTLTGTFAASAAAQ